MYAAIAGNFLSIRFPYLSTLAHDAPGAGACEPAEIRGGIINCNQNQEDVICPVLFHPHPSFPWCINAGIVGTSSGHGFFSGQGNVRFAAVRT
jgi:hypothetical protein